MRPVEIEQAGEDESGEGHRVSARPLARAFHPGWPARLNRQPSQKALHVQAQGFDVTAGSWRGLAVPGDCPDHVIARLDTGLRQALDDPSLHADFAAHGMSVDPLPAADFGRLVRQEYRTSGALLASLGLNVRAAKHA